MMKKLSSSQDFTAEVSAVSFTARSKTVVSLSVQAAIAAAWTDARAELTAVLTRRRD